MIKKIFFIVCIIILLFSFLSQQNNFDSRIYKNLGGDASRASNGNLSFSLPSPNLFGDEIKTFMFGKRIFDATWLPRIQQSQINILEPNQQVTSSVFLGLGPSFNRASCSHCHVRDGRGKPTDLTDNLSSMIFKLGIINPNIPTNSIPHPIYGDQFHDQSISTIISEKIKVYYNEITEFYPDGISYHLRKPYYILPASIPEELKSKTLISARIPPALIGLGLLENIPVQSIMELADPYDKNNDGISGKINLVANNLSQEKKSLGRFGWKASTSNLYQQNATAAFNDMGLTNILFPGQNCKIVTCKDEPISLELNNEFLDKLTFYTKTLSVPMRRNLDNISAQKGEQIFFKAECHTCHKPSWIINHYPSARDVITPQTIFPFTDLLLHDMGHELSDNLPDAEATGSEWRTPPLWGIGLNKEVSGYEFYLHDGRARNLEEAILWHNGEGKKSSDIFKNLSRYDREALISFLKSL
ncbi:MAG: c-type cytochrome [Alphaproteobacteria bacterium]|nr:c-type cytochrome [Alphaproteobacteria bacterium]